MKEKDSTIAAKDKEISQVSNRTVDSPWEAWRIDAFPVRKPHSPGERRHPLLDGYHPLLDGGTLLDGY